jgi:hypothetical protein
MKEIIGTHPDCICDGDQNDLWCCECPECKALQEDALEDLELETL